MEIPQINQTAVAQLIASAKKMLAAYEKELERVTYDLEVLGQKKSGLAALLGYIEIADKRKSILKDCSSFADAYASSTIINQEELAGYRSFMSVIESRIASYEKLKHETEEAINFLNQDLRLLNDISTVHFEKKLTGIFKYYSIPGRGWSFLPFSSWRGPTLQHLLFTP